MQRPPTNSREQTAPFTVKPLYYKPRPSPPLPLSTERRKAHGNTPMNNWSTLFRIPRYGRIDKPTSLPLDGPSGVATSPATSLKKQFGTGLPRPKLQSRQLGAIWQMPIYVYTNMCNSLQANLA